MPANASWSRDCSVCVPVRWSRPRWWRWVLLLPRPRSRNASRPSPALLRERRANIKKSNRSELVRSITIGRAGILALRSLISARQCHELFQIFHRSADLRGRAVDRDLRGGITVAAGAADLGISGSGAADGGGARAMPGRQPQGDRRDGIDADRGADQRGRKQALY